MNPDGSEPVNLTRHRANDFSPTRSPTGEQILFVSDRGKTSDLYLMDADGRHVRQVFHKALDRGHPTWAPDGKRIASFQNLLLQLRVKATPEEFSLVSSGYGVEIEKMQEEVLEYLTQHVYEPVQAKGRSTER